MFGILRFNLHLATFGYTDANDIGINILLYTAEC